MKNEEQLKRIKQNEDLLDEIKGLKAQSEVVKSKLKITEEKKRPLKIAT
jgi:hypothetical protein